AHEARTTCAVAERGPQVGDHGEERRLRHGRRWPEPVADLLLRHHPGTTRQQEVEEIERLRPQRDRLIVSQELPPIVVEGELTETEDGRAPRRGRGQDRSKSEESPRAFRC